ncbi:MAG: gfo/Idh/MocA family oxidoreductase, partial [Candidatus Omnitrophica bacterium]|nr:gfo/Idh/MocA family oxidoreductase [Candidatus Omnitrophota bacterium]
GARVFSQCRQIDNCWTYVGESVIGSNGTSNPGGSIDINGWDQWRFSGANPDPYVQEHTDLIASIRAGQPLNEARQVAESTLDAIMGRESAYSGKMLEWDYALNSKMSLMPEKLEFGPLPTATVAIPGKHEFA